ncbi:hypothetical protein EYF80_002998 [Liparis tanakae]|uniref:Uncharacterized protein n=1 Tax=Liparis tanakae TaxID=230148 RepID=A0A4Z2J8X4_9TELE|nr:hypothetical protein EYF80_002998 [Liparis tanakae]
MGDRHNRLPLLRVGRNGAEQDFQKLKVLEVPPAMVVVVMVAVVVVGGIVILGISAHKLNCEISWHLSCDEQGGGCSKIDEL